MENCELADRTRGPVLGVSSVRTTNGGTFTHKYGPFPLRKGATTITHFVAVEDYGDSNAALLDLVE